MNCYYYYEYCSPELGMLLPNTLQSVSTYGIGQCGFLQFYSETVSVFATQIHKFDKKNMKYLMSSAK